MAMGRIREDCLKTFLYGLFIFEYMASGAPALALRKLNLLDESAFMRAIGDWPEEDLAWFTWHWTPGVPFQQVLEKIERESKGEGLPEQFVPATMFYAFVDGQIVGRLHLRHRLNEALAQRGGHIGYSVSPRFRNQGWATEMLRLGLRCAADLGISEVMLTCADANVASWRVIEKVGGCLDCTFIDSKNGELVRKYWISTDAGSDGSAGER